MWTRSEPRYFGRLLLVTTAVLPVWPSYHHVPCLPVAMIVVVCHSFIMTMKLAKPDPDPYM